MSNVREFIGNIPYQGKLKIWPTESTEIIGFAEIVWQPKSFLGSSCESPSGMGVNCFMYFKEYEYKDDGSVEFINKNISNPNNIYRFDIAFFTNSYGVYFSNCKKNK